MATKKASSPKAAKSPELLAQELEATGDFKILRRIRSEGHFGDLERTDLPSLALIDFETTGLNASTHKAIEIGLLRVACQGKVKTLHKAGL